MCALHISGNTRRVHLWISRNVRDNGRHQEGRGGGDKLRTNFFVPAFAAAPPMSFFFFDAPVPPAPLSSSSSSPTPLSRPPRGSGFMHKMSSAALMRFISGCTVQKCTIISTQVQAFVGSNTHTHMRACMIYRHTDWDRDLTQARRGQLQAARDQGHTYRELLHTTSGPFPSSPPVKGHR